VVEIVNKELVEKLDGIGTKVDALVERIMDISNLTERMMDTNKTTNQKIMDKQDTVSGAFDIELTNAREDIKRYIDAVVGDIERLTLTHIKNDMDTMNQKIDSLIEIKEKQGAVPESLNAPLRQVYGGMSSLELKIDRISDKIGSLTDILERAYSYHQSITQSLIDDGAFDVAKGYISFLQEKSKPRPKATKEPHTQKREATKKSGGTEKAESTTV